MLSGRFDLLFGYKKLAKSRKSPGNVRFPTHFRSGGAPFRGARLPGLVAPRSSSSLREAVLASRTAALNESEEERSKLQREAFGVAIEPI